MPPRNSENKKDVIKELEKKISPVLVVNNSSLKPYVELFEYYPENIYQQPLGSLIGFFEVKEYSEDSAYIVNFLTSVLKKEYYINPKRQVAESMDSALHKVNLALSELVKQGNMEWLGNLHAAICVLEKNNAHFSVSGNAKIFIQRNGTLSCISDGLASDSPEPHPLKTFVNVSSGRLEKNDRLLITSDDIFHIFSVTELKKNFQRFEGEKLVQFLKTALSNQLEMIASIVVEMTEAKTVSEIRMPTERKKSPTALNAFSEKTFTKVLSKETGNVSVTKFPEEEPLSEYTDKKTGHIYVQGETSESDKNIKANIYWDMTKEKISQIWYSVKNNIRRSFVLRKKQLAKKIEQRRLEKEKQAKIAAEEKKIEQERKALEDMQREQELAREKENQLKRQEEERLQQEAEERQRREIEESAQMIETASVEIDTEKEEEENEPEELTQKENTGLSFKEKLALAMKHYQQESAYDNKENTSIESETEEKTEKLKYIWENVRIFIKKIKEKIGYSSKKLLGNVRPVLSMIFAKIRSLRIDKQKMPGITPHFSKIKNLFLSFSYKQKIYLFLAFVLIFIVPFFIARFLNRPKPQTITELTAVAPISQTEVLAEEKNINFSAEKQTVLAKSDIVGTLVTNTGSAVVSKISVTTIENGQQTEYQLPANSGAAMKSTFMKDLSLVFILTNQNKIISFSPVSKKFAENNITLPTNATNDFIGTYLTYLYILDPQDNQIYRYPRANGGFGDKTNWLKDTTSLTGVSDMTIDDNIYCIQNNAVLKLFKGKKQDFSLEASKTPVNFDKIFTTIDSGSLYILDTKNSRIVQYNKTDGSITAQYFNEALKDGMSLAVDEKNKLAYVPTSSGLISISIQ